MSKKVIHKYNWLEDIKIPIENRDWKYSVSLCGYLRKNTTCVTKDVTCKLCLKLMEVNNNGKS